MKFQLQVEMNNAAFAPSDEWGYEADIELGRILHSVAQHFGSALEPAAVAGATGRLLDINGNTVGAWKITEGE